MKRYIHQDAVITIPEEAVNEATIEMAERTLHVKTSSPKALQLGEFVRECYGYVEALSLEATRLQNAKAQVKAARRRMDQFKEEVDTFKATETSNVSELAFELRTRYDDAIRVGQTLDNAEVDFRKAQRRFEAVCQDIESD